MPACREPIISIIDGVLIDLQALLKFSLFFAETATKDDFAAYKGEMVAILYILQEKVSKAGEASNSLYKIERMAAFIEDARH